MEQLTAAVVVVADRGYRTVNSVVGSLVVGLAIIADTGDNLTRRDSTLELPLDHQFDDALRDIGFDTALNDLVALESPICLGRGWDSNPRYASASSLVSV